MHRYLPAAALGLACAGCAELDKSLSSAEHAVSVATASAKSIGKIASADDRTAAARALAKQSGENYERNPQALINDIRQVERDYQRLVESSPATSTGPGARRKPRSPPVPPM
jgi:hypothetical protein